MANFRVELRPILPGDIDERPFLIEWTKAVENETAIMQRGFARMTDRFKPAHRPRYTRQTLFGRTTQYNRLFRGYGGLTAGVSVASLLTIRGGVFHWLDAGTRHRYMTMTTNYRAGTKPGRIGYSGRRGTFWYLDVTDDRGPIIARRFIPTMIARRKRHFQNAVKRGTQRAARRMFRGARGRRS